MQVFVSAMFLSLLDMVSLTDSVCWFRLLSSIVGVYSSTLFSALTNSKSLGKEFKYEAFMMSTPDIFPHLPAKLSLGMLASSLHPGHCMEATMTLEYHELVSVSPSSLSLSSPFCTYYTSSF